MVYRGKPSAGCENCRKAKKRCGLEQPACSRCVKLKKTCSGYRDTTQLQIQDESESVKLKANRQKARTPVPESTRFATPVTTHNGAANTTPSNDVNAPPNSSTQIQNGIPTPGTPGVAANTPHSDSSDETVELPSNIMNQLVDFDSFTFEDIDNVDLSLNVGIGMPFALKPQVDDVATAYFFNNFTAHNGHWMYLREQAARQRLDPMVAIAIRACGMAAMDNLQAVAMGRQYTRALYADALGQLNTALQDPKRCKTDAALIAVSMLAYFENLSCDCRQSILSWKAHVTGATQLLKLRGKSQFKTFQGRMLFRETRASILIHCIWDDLEPPTFLLEWEEELKRQTPDRTFIKPADDMTLICYDFAALRSQMQRKIISDIDAAKRATQIEMNMVNWSIEAMSHSGEAWTYYDLEVPDSPHVWNGTVHAYSNHPAPTVWNTYRNMRILLTRTQEILMHRFPTPPQQKEAQIAYYRAVRRQMTDDICAGIPTQLGHASPAYNSPCTLITAYSSIWPLFFACTCVLERIGLSAWNAALAGNAPVAASAATSQAYWLIGRMDYISKQCGLRWAEGVAATLKGDFSIHGNLLGDRDPSSTCAPSFGASGVDTRMLMEQSGGSFVQRQLEKREPIWLGKGTKPMETNAFDLDEMTTRKRHGWPMGGALSPANFAQT